MLSLLQETNDSDESAPTHAPAHAPTHALTHVPTYAMVARIASSPFLLPRSSSCSSSSISDSSGPSIIQLKRELKAAHATIRDLSTSNHILNAENSVTQAHCTLANLELAHACQMLHGKQS